MAKTYRTPSVATLGNAEVMTLGTNINKGFRESSLHTTTTASMLDL
jgi:hypothetical protein